MTSKQGSLWLLTGKLVLSAAAGGDGSGHRCVPAGEFPVWWEPRQSLQRRHPGRQQLWGGESAGHAVGGGHASDQPPAGQAPVPGQ